ncbi:MAG: sodium-translocating pyrophosphatase [Candidatus Lokiarchaeota archaeon]|nr:sodium-translocating pyrophosphatase [Candidatus Lokiarchaeota archaeon]MBD3199491.1 sodium-translocating pyrophosphatase [Candidatus Lokiarchaeota archaeon]
MEKLLLLIPLISGVIAILLALYFAKLVMSEDPGNERMQEVSGYIESGAKTFIKVQYKILTIFVIALAVILYFVPGLSIGHVIAYLIGCVGSMWAGWLGMIVGVKANTRAAQGCTISTKKGFDISFFGGAVMGLAVVGVALIGISAIYWTFGEPVGDQPLYVLGFSFGASSIALFMKCGGGIYTKTADVGADLVGKAEYNLPEDDPRNPASIADNVGDNVGDIAGMGSDLFDSYVASIVAAMLLSVFLSLNDATNKIYFTMLPIMLSAFGLFASIIGIYAIKRWKTGDPSSLLNNGTYIATVVFVGLAAICALMFSVFITDPIDLAFLWALWACAAIGLASGIVIGFTSDYYTREDKKPTREIAHAAQEGDAVVILSGFSYGLVSVVPPAVGIVAAMTFSYLIPFSLVGTFEAGVFGVAIAAVGMLSIVGTIVSNDAYGPICDNARGIAEQGDLGDDVIRVADKLDMAGNTAKAITKGYAIGAANLTVLALLFSFSQDAGAAIMNNINLLNVSVLIGAFIGVVAPALFSAVLILAVQRNAALMVDEIRRQFEEDPGILKGETAADFNKCIDIATKGALKELVIPSIISIAIPMAVGLVFGVAALGAFLAGSILSGFVFAIFMANSGGAWDNAKKWIEDGNLGGKGTDAHKASITGDTVGDPFKDTAGPSINTLLVVMSLTASIFIGLFLALNAGSGLLGAFF